MSLRILGGQFKGRMLKCPTTALTKPTTSILKKAVFDICQSYILDSRFLDLFACSGSMGIEALSRGAAFAAFVEKDRRAIQTLRENISTLHIEDRTQLLCTDVFNSLPKLQAPFDIVYIDPPYALMHTSPHPLFSFLKQLIPLLNPQATIFLEQGSPALDLPIEPLFQSISTRRFGTSILHEYAYL